MVSPTVGTSDGPGQLLFRRSGLLINRDKRSGRLFEQLENLGISLRLRNPLRVGDAA
jgi:hypothetical protein